MGIIEILSERLGGGQIRLNEPMAAHTTFKIGGPADVFVKPCNTEELVFVLSACRAASVPWFVLGNGSNLLVGDKGIRGVTISMSSINRIALDGGKIRAGCGALLPVLSKFAKTHALSGLEFAEGIPGSVGGAVVMNAGAYGGEVGDVFCSALAIDKNGNLIELNRNEMAFSYRTSMAQKQGYVVAEATLAPTAGDPDQIAAKMADFRKQRISKQPLDMPSAGSAFKRPPGKFAGKLIMDAGLRGFTIGGAMVSEKHCGFIVNKGGATADHVLALMEHIKQTVYKKFGICLEPEVKIVGE